MAIRRGKYVQHDAAGAICAICRKRRNTTRSVQRHVKQVHSGARVLDLQMRDIVRGRAPHA